MTRKTGTPISAMRHAPGLALANRLAASLLGGYLFTWGCISLGLVGLVAAGVDFHEAETGVLLLTIPLFLTVFLIVFLKAFASPHPGRVWALLFGGGVCMAAGAWALQQVLLA